MREPGEQSVAAQTVEDARHWLRHPRVMWRARAMPMDPTATLRFAAGVTTLPAPLVVGAGVAVVGERRFHA